MFLLMLDTLGPMILRTGPADTMTYPCLQGNTSNLRFDKSKKEGEITLR